MTLLSIPLSAFFFFTLPRTASPLLDIGVGNVKTGFTSTVNLGGISSIEEDTSVVMRVKIRKLSESQLYWRVITFDTFDGKTWKKTLNENYLYHIKSAIQKEVTLNRCVTSKKKCELSHSCPVHPVWFKIKAKLIEALKEINFAQLSGTAS